MDYVTINQKVREPIKIPLYRDSKFQSKNKTILYEKLAQCKLLLINLKENVDKSTHFSQFINPKSDLKQIIDIEFAIKTITLMLFGTHDPNDIPPPPPKKNSSLADELDEKLEEYNEISTCGSGSDSESSSGSDSEENNERPKSEKK